MGYLTIEGVLMTYSQYKDNTENYKMHGLKQFIKIYQSHKDLTMKRENLHWGEEIEYCLF